MVRYAIEYKGGSIELPQGETVVGRGLACPIRFNDPAVSRRHLVLRVDDDRITIEDLTATNPTRLNGNWLPPGSTGLQDDDVLELGNTWFRVARVVDSGNEEQTYPGSEPEEQTYPGREPEDLVIATCAPDPTEGQADLPSGIPPSSPSSPLPPRASVSASGLAPVALPTAGTLSSAIAATTEAISARMVSGVPLPKLESQNCPRCRAKVPTASDDCPSCGYRWPTGRPTSVTQRLDLRAFRRAQRSKQQGPERRRHARIPLDLPVIYDSDMLTFDAVARDISLGGLFIATELLDDEGTPCRVTILPDGAPAVPIDGFVSRIVTDADQSGSAHAGMGIAFTEMGNDARGWLEALFRP